MTDGWDPQGERVEVDVKTMNLFLLRDRVSNTLSSSSCLILAAGTVISFHPTPSLALTAPISRRLRPLETVLKKSSLLVQ